MYKFGFSGWTASNADSYRTWRQTLQLLYSGWIAETLNDFQHSTWLISESWNACRETQGQEHRRSQSKLMSPRKPERKLTKYRRTGVYICVKIFLKIFNNYLLLYLKTLCLIYKISWLLFRETFYVLWDGDETYRLYIFGGQNPTFLKVKAVTHRYKTPELMYSEV